MNVFPIDIPPLRNRREDIGLLARRFLEMACRKLGKSVTGLTAPAYAALIDYDWPGNIRELENMVERAVILADDGDCLDLHHLFSGGEQIDHATYLLDKAGNLFANKPDPKQDFVVDEAKVLDSVIDTGVGYAGLEARLLERALQRSEGNLSAGARLLGLTRAQFEYRLKKARDQQSAEDQ